MLHFLMRPAERQALELGLFRMRGEIHKWMYDSHSLSEMLQSAGFRDVRRCEALESRITDWKSFHLDASAEGKTHKPDSLFMEAVK